MNKTLLTWLFFFVTFSLQSCASSYQYVIKPKSPDALVRNVAAAINNDLLLRDDFYTNDNIKLLLGARDVEMVFSETGAPLFGHKEDSLPTYRYFISDFSGLVPATRVQSDVIKFVDGHGSIKQVVFRMSFSSPDEQLGMKGVLSIVGDKCTEDQKAENELFMAVTRESFNPRQKPLKVMVCRSVHAGYERFFRLTFNEDGRLDDLYVTVTAEGL